MLKTKVISLLKTFSDAELKSFALFIRSPYFNRENVQIKIYDLLKEHYPEFDSPHLEKEQVYAKLYPGRKYNDGALRNIFSDLLRLAETFLSVERFQSENFRKNIFLLEELKDRKQKKHFLKQKEKTEKLIEKNVLKDVFYFDKKTELTVVHAQFLRVTEETFIRRDKLLQETSDLVTISSLIKLIYYNTDMLSVQSNISNITYRLNLADEIDFFFERSGKRYLEIPGIKGYWLSFKLIQTGNEKYFYLLKDLLNMHIKELDNSQNKNIFTILENYCYKKITEGKEKFVREQFLLYKQSIENQSYTSIGFISSAFFMSIVATGFEAGESEWVNHFIDKYIGEVNEESQKNTFLFCNALKYYRSSDYQNSLTEMSKVTAEEFSFKQNIRSLTLKIYYDLNETEPFYSHIDSYRHFIQNNKLVHNNVREPINNYILYAKKIFDMKNSLNQDSEFEMEKIRNEILNTKAIINKLWLLRKIDELKKRYDTRAS